MNYEQRYKEALKAVKELREANPSDDGIKNWVEDKFPELAESEDEKIINKLIAVVELYYGIGDDSEKQICLSWLKSPKQRMGWKPSDEQIGVIEAVINNRSFQRRHLDSLYEQLKKLKGE